MLVLAANAATGQSAAPNVQFEVASVKVSAPFTPGLASSPGFHVGTRISGTHVEIGRMRLVDLIAQAYGVKRNQIVGPSWLNTTEEIFDIDARMPAGATAPQAPLMIQAMLADRFQVVIHRETRERAGYFLVTAKDGPKLTTAEPETEPDAGAASQQKALSLNGGDSTAPRQRFAESSDGTSIRYVNPRADMNQLTAMLEPILEQPISDMTGLKGYYKIALDLSMADIRKMLGTSSGMGANGGGSPADLASEPGGRTVLSSLRAMGLHLEPHRIPIQVIVVDRVEAKPTAN